MSNSTELFDNSAAPARLQAAISYLAKHTQTVA